jgi:transposase
MTREIITTVERRRKWPDEEKLRIMSEALVPGASTCAVADRNLPVAALFVAAVRTRGTVAGYRTQRADVAASDGCVRSCHGAVDTRADRGCAAPSEPPRLAEPRTTCAPAAARQRVARIEVMLANGRTLKVDESIDPAVLARLAAALEEPGTRSRSRLACASISPAAQPTCVAISTASASWRKRC